MKVIGEGQLREEAQQLLLTYGNLRKTEAESHVGVFARDGLLEWFVDTMNASPDKAAAMQQFLDNYKKV